MATPIVSVEIVNFPQEIIEEILARLPVRSLLRFRCVSKSWCSLISSKCFIEAHLTISKKDASFSRWRIIFTRLLPHYTIQDCSLQSLLNGVVTEVFDFSYLMKNTQNFIRLVGCCNGLLCIAINGKYFCLLNPSTRNFRKLPDMDSGTNMGLFISKYGFGFDETNEDYKIVGVMNRFWMGRLEIISKVYSLKLNSWKRIEFFNGFSPSDDTGKFVDGKLHWGTRSESNSRGKIYSYDLASELCEKIDLPNYDSGKFSSLGVVEGCLSALIDIPRIRVDVWILKPNGMRKCWQRVLKIPYLDTDLYRGPYSSPLCIGLNGRILLPRQFSFMKYDPQHESVERVEIRDSSDHVEADIYVESLIPL